jgi:acyl-CoA synthetase (AMP-forming)/AMP-acid ligase II
MSELSYLSTDDQGLFNVLGRGPHSAIPFRTVHSAFLHHAVQSPRALAIYDLTSSPTKEVTYADLRQYARFIAVQLQKHGIHRNSRVTLVAKRGMAMVAGILGILICGAQYVPLDGSVAPDQTLQRVINQSETNIVLCLRAFKSRIKELEAFPIVLEDLLQEAETKWSDIDLMESPNNGDENSGCYVLYTSGTSQVLYR